MRFSYDNPLRIHAGAGCAARLVDEAGGWRRIFLVTTRSVEAALGPTVERLLGGRLVGRFARIRQHTPIEDVRAAAEAARALQPDCLLSLGGGSAVDATKSIAFILATGLSLDDRDRARALEPETLPHLAVPTTLSAAEMDGAAGFTDSREKVGIRARTLVPTAVFYDADLTLPTPLPLWLSTGIRAVDHAIEGLLAPDANPLSEAAALAALQRLRPALERTHADPGDLQARTEAQLGAWLSMLLPQSSSRGLSHVLGKSIGARYGIPHGVTSCLLLPHVLRHLGPAHRATLERVALALGAETDAADAVASLVGALGLPQHLGAYGLSDADLQAAAEPLARHIPVAEAMAIFRAAW
ncbi:iron-containing alcohol dehydrogenase [Nannocystis punicea]|uniref:Iron-containing alcohol dehydrogenase n=1 Tax=Nannocystis punicea TaxID=2995304 RepID=A0ABY7H4N2_9BACT|nr:iron-containing alcohol dehydrogenase [Nannocystis poenicansa]WAS94227.1 iron-containing alcohol dehydrogenase [Nannocystis poenicansa]